jgi:outer membrane lipoprotein carrier protein
MAKITVLGGLMKIYAKMQTILRKAVCSAFLVATFSTAVHAQETEPSAEEAVAKMKEFYNSANDYEASFVQTTAHKLFQGRLQRAYGKVKFKKGGLMRWEYERPENKLFIYDGATLWIYEVEVPQIFTEAADTERLRKALAFLTGDERILEEYRVKKLNEKKYGFEQGVVLGLWPKDLKSPFRRVELYLDRQSFRVVRSVVVDQEGNRNRFDFSKPIINGNLPAEIFSFTPPAGVPVIKAPQQ